MKTKTININIVGDVLLLDLDGKKYSFQLNEISKRLERATELEKNTFVISPSGYGIHWPLLDEDISIPALIKMIL